MTGSENTASGGSAMLHGINEHAVCLLGIFKILVLLLLWEGVPVEPIHQLKIHAHATEGILWRMNVKVNHTGENQRITVVK